ncbi:AAA family ATPase [Hyphomonas sp.]|uniref:AAA family ATPase n=1 Tax=Hyphomonas sp. TaxID=87 RepID=UPI00391A5F9F
MLLSIAIHGYRSLRDLVLPLQQLNVVTGGNGSGKSSLYRAIQLLGAVAQGRVATALATEGGLNSTLWAGPEAFSRAVKQGDYPVQGTVRKERVSLKLGFASEDFGYAIDLGLPSATQTAFARDPEIKAEAVWYGEVLRPAALLAARNGPAVRLRQGREMEVVQSDLATYETLMSFAANKQTAPELIELRERMRAWRFYDHFRTDKEAPARWPQLGTRTPVLSNDGTDLAAAIQTIFEIGEREDFDAAIEEAFPGGSIEIRANADGFFEVEMHQHGLLRPLRATELSDGTLRYLLLAAALLTPRPPPLMVLNEPETSLHQDLLGPLAHLILRASQHCQMIVVSHAAPLVNALVDAGAQKLELCKELGETIIPGIDAPRWEWPKR